MSEEPVGIDPRPNYPEHEKLREVAHESGAIGAFVEEFLRGRGIMLAHYYEFADTGGKQLTTHGVPRIEELLADFYEIDLDKIEVEKRSMLKAIRSMNDREEQNAER